MQRILSRIVPASTLTLVAMACHAAPPPAGPVDDAALAQTIRSKYQPSPT
jgi:hypothetical protein